MRNLMTFKIFESESRYNYTLDDVKELPAFQLLKAVGYYDSSTDVMKRHMSMRLYNDALELTDPNDNVIVYSSGYVRKTTPAHWTASSQRVMKKFPNDGSLLTWNNQFLYVYDWTLKQFKKKGIDKYSDVDKSEFSDSEAILKYMYKIFDTNKEVAYRIYDGLKDEDKSKFLKKMKLDKEDFEERKKKYELGMNIVSKWLT
jgi:hypothetical protein